jgi:hypothetical protein
MADAENTNPTVPDDPFPEQQPEEVLDQTAPVEQGSDAQQPEAVFPQTDPAPSQQPQPPIAPSTDGTAEPKAIVPPDPLKAVRTETSSPARKPQSIPRATTWGVPSAVTQTKEPAKGPTPMVGQTQEQPAEPLTTQVPPDPYVSLPIDPYVSLPINETIGVTNASDERPTNTWANPPQASQKAAGEFPRPLGSEPGRQPTGLRDPAVKLETPPDPGMAFLAGRLTTTGQGGSNDLILAGIGQILDGQARIIEILKGGARF